MTVPSREREKRAIPFHRRLGAHLFAGILVMSALSLIAMLLATRKVVTDQAMENSSNDLREARRAFDSFTSDTIEFASAECRLIAEDYNYRAFFPVNSDLSKLNPATMTQLKKTFSDKADHYRTILNADFCIITNPSGRWLGQAGWSSVQAPPEGLVSGIRSAQQGESYHGFVTIGDSLYLVTAEPSRFGPKDAAEILGVLTFGYRLNDKTALSEKRVTGCDVSYLSGTTISGTSLSPGRREAFRQMIRSPESAVHRWGDTPAFRRIGDGVYVGAVYSIDKKRSPGDAESLVLLQDLEPTQRFLDRIQNALIGVGFLTFAFAAGSGLLFSQRLSRPLSEISAAAEEIADGSWDRRAPVTGTDETRRMADAFNRMTLNLRHYYQEALSQAEHVAEALAEVQQSYGATMEALSRALDQRDNETEGHSQRVTEYALFLAERLNVDATSYAHLRLGALLHDIGKIGVPDSILRKPGKLEPDEMAIMRRHCEFGLQIVRGIPHLDGAATVIRCHHERYDGDGYPRGLIGTEIPFIARIFSVVDTLDAMTSDRSYRSARSFEEAVSEIRNCSGTQFDPRIVEALEQNIEGMLERVARRPAPG